MTLITTNFEQHTYLEFLVWEIFTNYFTFAILIIIYFQLEIMLLKPNYNLFIFHYSCIIVSNNTFDYHFI